MRYGCRVVVQYGTYQHASKEYLIETAKKDVQRHLANYLVPEVVDNASPYQETVVELDLHVYTHNDLYQKMKKLKSSLSKDDFDLVYTTLMK